VAVNLPLVGLAVGLRCEGDIEWRYLPGNCQQ